MMMLLDNINEIIEGANWVTLFVLLFFGIVFAPVNRESIILFMGALSSTNIIYPGFSFIVSVLATYFGYSFGYFIARILEKIFLQNPSQKTKKRIEKCYQLLQKFDIHSILISYYIPGVRHIFPVILGLGLMKTVKFSFLSLIGAVIWTATFFAPAYILGEKTLDIIIWINELGKVPYIIVAAIIILGIIIFYYKFYRFYRNKKDNNYNLPK